jgi:queuine tRNA-ribosyltransferase
MSAWLSKTLSGARITAADVEVHPDDSQALFGIVQAVFSRSTRTIGAVPAKTRFSMRLWSGCCETKQEMYATLDVATPLLPENKPRYLMGVGEPDDLAQAIQCGVDIFDCVIPTRLARHGAALTPYGRINLRNLVYARDESPLQDDCDCYCCQTFSHAYLRHLVHAKELLGHYLLSLHNVRFLIRHVQNMRNAILEGNLATYTEPFLRRYLQLA